MLECRNLGYWGDYSLECRNCNRSLEKGRSWDLWDTTTNLWYQTIVCRRCGERVAARLNRRRYQVRSFQAPAWLTRHHRATAASASGAVSLALPSGMKRTAAESAA